MQGNPTGKRSAVVAVLALTTAAAGQMPTDGFRVLGPYLGSDTFLVDPRGVIVHT